MTLARARATRAEVEALVAGQTVTSRFLQTVERYPDLVALRQRLADGDWRVWTYRDYAARVAAAGAYLRSLGVGPGDRVLLMTRNIPEFHFFDLGTLFCGGATVSIFNSSSPERIRYFANHCGATVAVVENNDFAERFASARSELPELRHVVDLTSSDAVYALANSHGIDLGSESALNQPDSLATVIYTSGTTGPPKGVMISHTNILVSSHGYVSLLDVDPVGFRTISYLPMAHIAERMAGHYTPLLAGFQVTSCPDPREIADYVQAIRPQRMFGVPRIWERLRATVEAELGDATARRAEFDAAMASSASDRATEHDAAMLHEVRRSMGLDAVRFAVTGGAPVPASVVSWYRALGVPLSEVYGMSESTGPMTWEPYRVKPGTVGVAYPGCDVFLAHDGEICCRGGNVFLGYWNDPMRTAEVLESDGTLHSGDIGVFDDEGYLTIIDRKKDICITSGGQNVSPANVEAALKQIPLVGQACVVADGRPFVAALLVLDPEIAPMWARSQHIAFESVADLATNAEVRDEIERTLPDVMVDVDGAERVKAFTVLGSEWLPDSDELTPTAKLRRTEIHRKYAAVIEAMYSSVVDR